MKRIYDFLSILLFVALTIFFIWDGIYAYDNLQLSKFYVIGIPYLILGVLFAFIIFALTKNILDDNKETKRRELEKIEQERKDQEERDKWEKERRLQRNSDITNYRF